MPRSGFKTRALARAHKTIRMLKADMDKHKRKVKSRNKQIERLTKKIRTNNASSNPNTLTPRRRTEVDLKNLSLTPTRQQLARRKLLLGNFVLAEVAHAKQGCTIKKRALLHRIISGKIARKYRCVKAISQATGMSRHCLGKYTSKQTTIPHERRMSLSKEIEQLVITFLSREDNSRTQPGKADESKDHTGEKRQTMVLTDYMRNLHYKFTAENTSLKVSLATFCRLRPKYILLASFITRNTCQCLRHMALKVQALRKSGIRISENPEHLLIHQHNIDELLRVLPNAVRFKIWKRVEQDNGFKKLNIVEEQSDSVSFISDIKKKLEEFADLVTRLRMQFQQLHTLKENLPQHEMVIQMDFAENFTCQYLNEVQSAYWNQSAVTIHPVIVDYSEEGKLLHQSYVIISDEMSHSATTVCAFIDEIVPSLKLLDPDVKTFHFWTDSPSSQYRNRYIFHLIANHKEIYNISARWNYFESGHGKGPCDGLGGTTKRMANDAIRQGKVIIQDPLDFYKWSETSTMKQVKFIFVSKQLCQVKNEAMMDNIAIKPVHQTMKLHAVAAVTSSHIKTRETSCYCNICITGMFCDTWNDEQLVPHVKKKQTTIAPSNTTETVTDMARPVVTIPVSVPVVNEGMSETVTVSQCNIVMTNSEAVVSGVDVFCGLQTNDFVAAVYDDSWFIGVIDEIDVEDGECKINFMVKAKEFYKWPQNPDRLWVTKSNVLCKISPFSKCGKFGRHFRLDKDEEIMVEWVFKEHHN